MRTGAALWHFWQERGYFTEGRRWLEAALARDGRVPATLRARALAGAGVLGREQGDYDRATVLDEESLALRWARGDRRGIAAALNSLAMIARDRGDYARAHALYRGKPGPAP